MSEVTKHAMPTSKRRASKRAALPDTKFGRVYVGIGKSHDASATSVKLHSLTGYYADEYIPPATSISSVYNIISDESAFKGHSSVSVVVMPCNMADSVEKDEAALELLCSEYSLTKIHFTHIFGHDGLRERRTGFLERFVSIVSHRQLWAVSLSADQMKLVGQLPFTGVTDRELYFILFWNIMEYVVQTLPPYSVFQIYFEQDNNRSAALAREYMVKLHEGIRQCQSVKERNSSICRHPMFFSKKALLFSSLADLAAYSNNYLQQKLDHGVPPSKLRSNHAELIKMARMVFTDYTSLYLSKLGAAQLILGEI